MPMEENTQKLIHTFGALANLGQEIADAGNFEEMLRTSFHVLLGSLAIRRGAVAEYDREARRLRFVARRGVDGVLDPMAVNKETEVKLIQLGVSGLTTEQASGEGLEILSKFVDASKIELLIPLVVRNELIGLVVLGEKASGEGFTAEDIETVSALARHIAVGIHSHQLLEDIERKANENQRLYEGLRAIYKETVRAFAAAIDIKDRYTQGHSVRVGKYSEIIAREMGWPNEEVEGIAIAGYLHDIGKLVVDIEIINSPNRINAKDSKQLSRHPAAGYQILAPIQHPYADIPLMARNHHERIDGRGYPDGLRGDEIPAGAKIVALADSFDAMTTDRPYRTRRPLEDVFADLHENAGKQFASEVVCAFCRAFLKEINGAAKDRRIIKLLGKGYDSFETLGPILNALISDLDVKPEILAVGHMSH
jgi:response regulator RpfG family c-di-GMP phosphodiesterase